MTSPFTPEQEARLRELRDEARSNGGGDPDAKLRLAALQIAGRLGFRGNPCDAADAIVHYIKTGERVGPHAAVPTGSEERDHVR
jgi:hypothetical protein